MATEETDKAKALAKEQEADRWIENEITRLSNQVNLGNTGANTDFGFGAGGVVDVGVIDMNDSPFGAFDFPTFGDDAFGPGGIFGLKPPPPRDKAPRKGKLDWGGWRKPGAAGPLQPGSKFEGGSSAPPPSVKVRPLHRDGVLDRRFEAKQHNREQLMPDFPGGTRTISLETTDERRQQFLTFHADPRLVAANRGPSPSYGTPVADVTEHGDLSGTRHAPLQSALRVVKSPRRTNKPGQTTDQAPADIPNSLSLNIGLTGLRETLGLLATDNSYGRNRHARLTRVDGGPWAIGPKGCKHRLGSDGDNDPILPMHHSCESLFSFDDNNATLDGPFAFNPILLGEYEARSGYTYRVDSCWDPGWNYVNGAASYRGAWTFRVQVPMGVTTPSEPKPPPEKPPPSTPGGGDEPKPPPTTGGGPGNPAPTPSGGKTPQSTIAAGATRVLRPRDHAAMAPALGISALVFRPRLMTAGVRDLTYGLDATMAELSAFEENAPAVLRVEAYGKQGGTAGSAIFGAAASIGPDFIRTQEPTKSTHRGGTANGGHWYFPPELGLEDVNEGAASDAARPASSSFVGYGPGVSIGFGLPDIQSGTMKTGVGLAGSSGDLVASSYSSAAAATEVLRQTSTTLKPQVAHAFGGVLSPAQITSNQNDYSPTGLVSASILRLETDAARSITGLDTGIAGRTIYVHNVGAFSITLKDEDTGSIADNRFALSSDLVLAADEVAVIQYDFTTKRWRAISGGGAAATGSFWLYTAKSADYTAASREFVNMDATAAIRTVTLPTAIGGAGRHIAARKSDASGNKVTVATTGGQTINGASTYDITAQYETHEFVSDGANWMRVT